MIDNLSATHWETGTPRFITAPGQLEGGDVLITDTTIFVGVSSRTNKEGIRQLTTHLRDTRIVPVKTRSFHLLCVCSYIGKNKIVIDPRIAEVRPSSRLTMIHATYCGAALVVERATACVARELM